MCDCFSYFSAPRPVFNGKKASRNNNNMAYEPVAPAHEEYIRFLIDSK